MYTTIELRNEVDQMLKDFTKDFTNQFGYGLKITSQIPKYEWKFDKESNTYSMRIKYAGYNKNTIKVKVSTDTINVNTTDGKLFSNVSVYKNMDIKSLKAVALDGILTLTVNKIADQEIIVE